MAEASPVVRFKQELRQEARDRGFVKLVDLEQKTGLSHSTASNAFNERQPMPSAPTVHLLVQAWGGDTQRWEQRRREALSAAPDQPGPPEEAGPVVVEPPPERSREPEAPSDDPDPSAGPPTRAETSARVERDPPRPGASRGGGGGRRRAALLVTVAVLVGAGLAVSAVHGTSSRSAGQTNPPASTPETLFAETVIPENAVRTLADPLTAQGLGESIPASTTVEVSCRVYTAEIPSALPDGYFYRIESAPWNGKYYAAANSFLNGDPAGQVDEYVTPTDLAVPLCDGV